MTTDKEANKTTHYFHFQGKVISTQTLDKSGGIPHDPNNKGILMFSETKIEAAEHGIIECKQGLARQNHLLREEQEKLKAHSGQTADRRTIEINILNIQRRRDEQITFGKQLQETLNSLVA